MGIALFSVNSIMEPKLLAAADRRGIPPANSESALPPQVVVPGSPQLYSLFVPREYGRRLAFRGDGVNNYYYIGEERYTGYATTQDMTPWFYPPSYLYIYYIESGRPVLFRTGGQLPHLVAAVDGRTGTSSDIGTSRFEFIEAGLLTRVRRGNGNLYNNRDRIRVSWIIREVPQGNIREVVYFDIMLNGESKPFRITPAIIHERIVNNEVSREAG